MLKNLRKAVQIAWKDTRIYYFSTPTITMGLLFPLLMFLTFWVGRGLSISEALPGLAALTVFFSGSSIAVTTLALERTKGTFDTQLAMPVSLLIIALGKIIASFLYSFIITIIPVLALVFLSQPQVVNLALFFVSVIFSALASAGLGMLLSASARHVHEAMTPLNLIRIPMMFISGLFAPITSLPGVLQGVAYIMPLTHTVNSLQYAILGLGDIHTFLINIGVLVVYAVIFLIVATKRLENTLK
ncbi:hypothetical protein B6U74_00895 [Candidatus Bathyarchaeota archaeon ex4484_205]|nr:MAG: hypothetical protein B6U74_00895 [Candidatus Bathyarchaeota archaeon ex4484_205]RLG68356.1 MAG: hypothetical protein DRN93_02970 [archaeon]